MSLQEIVKSSPYPIQQGIKHVYGLLPPRIRYGRVFWETYKFLQKSQWWNRKKLEEYQMQQLKNLLKHAYENVPYYRRIFNENGIKPKNIQNFSDFCTIPFLTKEIIRENLEELKSTNFSPRDFVKLTTGGSSGIPLHFFIQKAYSEERENAFIVTLWNRIGLRYDRDKRLALRGFIVRKNSGIEYNPHRKELICSTYHMDDEHLRQYFQRMKKEQIRFIHAHPSSAAIFAQFVLEKGLSYDLHAVLGASEKVFPFQRELILKAFRTRLFSWYGQTEQAILAGECELSENYHIFPEYGITEIIDENGKRITSPGISGELIGTGFNNYAMPLIRYRTGDIAKYSSTSCKCGRSYSLLESIEGRSYEYIVTRDGRRVSLTGLIFGQHFKAFERIKKMQLYQERKGELEIRIVRSPNYTQEDDNEIIKTIQASVKFGLNIIIRYVDHIPETERGKHQFLIQKLPIGLGDQ